MARNVTKKTESTALVNWDEQLAAQAETAAAMEANAGGGQFFSVRAGQLSFNGETMPGNQVAVIILDAILEHTFFEGQFDADNPVPPTCFAFGRDKDADMMPHQTVFDHDQAVNDVCGGCPNGEFGSAATGKGRACKWIRRLALIPAGAIINGRFTAEPDEDHFKSTPVAYLKVPPTSVRNYAGFVKQVAGALRRPPHGIFTRISVKPDPKTQLQVSFEALGPVPNELMAAVMSRHQEARDSIEFPYNLDAEPAAEKPAPKKPAGRRKY